MFGDDLLLPEGGLLLHVGPHKTGTTAIQGALRQARPAMAERGVVYAGKVRQHQMAALALTGGVGLTGDRGAAPKDWELLVSQASEARDARVIISSEYFDEADDAAARKAVEDLGGDRVHVVVTLRPLGKILPSAWQQYVRNGVRKSYPVWLDGLLNKPPYDRPSPSFWRRHRHADLVDRWAAVVGPDNVLVIVVDETDRDALMRTFEKIVGLPEGLLEAEKGWTNRSLTAAETELIRAVNFKFRRRKWPEPIYNRVIRLGTIEAMKRRRPLRQEPAIATPKWAIERANELAAEASARIAASGVRVLGDLSTLSDVAPGDDDVSIDEVALPIQAAASAIIGTVIGSGALEPKLPRKMPVRGQDFRTLSEIPSRELIATLSTRLRRRVRRLARR